MQFAEPVVVNVPFDLSIRNLWSTADEDCKVWYRSGDAWARAEPVATSPDGVTVELSEATTFGTGVITVPLSTQCTVTGSCTTSRSTCLDGDRFCLTRTGEQHVGMVIETFFGYRGGKIYWLTLVGTRTVAAAGFDVVGRTSLATSGSFADFPSATPAGDIVIDESGNR